MAGVRDLWRILHVTQAV